jgi:hypothetical protein
LRVKLNFNYLVTFSDVNLSLDVTQAAFAECFFQNKKIIIV